MDASLIGDFAAGWGQPIIALHLHQYPELHLEGPARQHHDRSGQQAGTNAGTAPCLLLLLASCSCCLLVRVCQPPPLHTQGSVQHVMVGCLVWLPSTQPGCKALCTPPGSTCSAARCLTSTPMAVQLSAQRAQRPATHCCPWPANVARLGDMVSKHTAGYGAAAKWSDHQDRYPRECQCRCLLLCYGLEPG
ncbi:hypothetical protein HaLaN_10194, partial [Haematococcus lacustris]